MIYPIDRSLNKINWNEFSIDNAFNWDICAAFAERVNWLSVIQTIRELFGPETERLIATKRLDTDLDWNSVTEYIVKDPDACESFADMVNWNAISTYVTDLPNLEDQLTFARRFHDQLYWGNLSGYIGSWPLEYLREFEDSIDWFCWSGWCEDPDLEVIEAYADRVDWHEILKSTRIPMDMILRHLHRIDIIDLSAQPLDEDFLRRHFFEMCAETVSRHQDMSFEFVLDYAEYLDWLELTPRVFEMFSDEQLDKISDHMVWESYPMTERFMDRHMLSGYRGNHIEILMWVKLSDTFIQRHETFLAAHYMSEMCIYQSLPMAFVDKFVDKIEWNALGNNARIRPEVVHKYLHRFTHRTYPIRNGLKAYGIRRAMVREVSKKIGLPSAVMYDLIAHYL